MMDLFLKYPFFVFCEGRKFKKDRVERRRGNILAVEEERWMLL
jgi:hypothetical protein